MTLQQMRERMHTDGWCIIREVIPPREVDAVRARVLDTVDRYRHTRVDAPSHIGAVTGLLRYDQSFAPYLAEPRLLALAAALLGPGLRISYHSSVVNYPGNERSEWHADWPFNQRNAGHLPAPYPDLVCHLTTLWMLSDFTADNGATLVVRGSHRRGDNPTGSAQPPSPRDEVRLTGRGGSVAVCDSRLWHAAGANGSPKARVGLAIRYAPWWLNLEVLRPGSGDRARVLAANPGRSENQVPPLPRAAFARLPAAVQPLLQHWVGDV